MARPDIAFSLAGEERAPVTWAAALPVPRAGGRRLGEASQRFSRKRHRRARRARRRQRRRLRRRAVADARNALGQYLLVTAGPVRDQRMILGAVRAGLCRLYARDRHPVVALFVTLDAQEVDATCFRPRPKCASATPGWCAR